MGAKIATEYVIDTISFELESDLMIQRQTELNVNVELLLISQ